MSYNIATFFIDSVEISQISKYIKAPDIVLVDGIEYEFDICICNDVKCEFLKNNKVTLILDNSYYNIFDIYRVSDNYYLIIPNLK